MNISASDAILLSHAFFGVSGCLAALWVFVETLNAQPRNRRRIRVAALVTAICASAVWIAGGYWYLHFYPADKSLILGGRWPFAHNFFMETKEHLFFVTALLALLLPIATREQLDTNPAARKLVLSVAALAVITGLSLEGAGAMIAQGAKVALLQNAAKDSR